MSEATGITASSRRERKKEAKIAAIEEAARVLFAERGYEATTTREIADRADIGIGTLFVYFPEKRDLLFQVMRHGLQRSIDDAFASLPARADLATAAAHVIRRLYRFYEDDPRLGRVFVKEWMFVDGERQLVAGQWSIAFLTRLAGLVDAARARGEVARDVVAMHVAYQLFATYYLGLVTWLAGYAPTIETRDAALDASIALLVRGMAPR